MTYRSLARALRKSLSLRACSSLTRRCESSSNPSWVSATDPHALPHALPQADPQALAISRPPRVACRACAGYRCPGYLRDVRDYRSKLERPDHRCRGHRGNGERDEYEIGIPGSKTVRCGCVYSDLVTAVRVVRVREEGRSPGKNWRIACSSTPESNVEKRCRTIA